MVLWLHKYFSLLSSLNPKFFASSYFFKSIETQNYGLLTPQFFASSFFFKTNLTNMYYSMKIFWHFWDITNIPLIQNFWSFSFNWYQRCSKCQNPNTRNGIIKYSLRPCKPEKQANETEGTPLQMIVK